jgi:hypothetical protein
MYGIITKASMQRLRASWLSPFILLKLKLSHYTPRRRLGGEEVQLLLILDLGTRWGWVVSVTPRPRFNPRERTPSTNCTGGWVGPRAGLDAEATGKILFLCRDRTSIARSSSSSPNTIVTELPGSPYFPLAEFYILQDPSQNQINFIVEGIVTG